MAFVKVKSGEEFYLFMNGKLIYKHWINTGQSLVFDKMPYTKNTLVSIKDNQKNNQ